MSRTRKIRFDPETDNEEDLMRQNGAHRQEMEDALLKGHVARAADAWDKSERLVDRLEEVRARKGQKANRRGENGPLHAQDTEIGHLTRGEIVIPLSAQTPQVMKALQEAMGNTLSRYVVGSGRETRNPESGLPAYYGNPTQQLRGGFQSQLGQVIGQQPSRFGSPSPGLNQPVPLPGQLSQAAKPGMSSMTGMPQPSKQGISFITPAGMTSPGYPGPITDRPEPDDEDYAPDVEKKIAQLKAEFDEYKEEFNAWKAKRRREQLSGFSVTELKGAVETLDWVAWGAGGVAFACGAISHPAAKVLGTAAGALAGAAAFGMSEVNAELKERKAKSTQI